VCDVPVDLDLDGATIEKTGHEFVEAKPWLAGNLNT